MHSVIRMIDVWKTFGEQHALQGINLHVKKGDFVFLVGPSGAGKTTLVRLVYREDVPSQGRVIINGQDTNRMHRKQIPFLRRNIGMVFQDFKLLPDKTVYENIAFVLQVTGVPGRDIKRRVRNVLSLVSLSDNADKRPDQLSGGEQQRVALARAMVRDPGIILADEPTGNLDPNTARDIVSLLEEINRLGCTVVVATHAQTVVDTMRKRVVELSNGCLVRDQERGYYS